MNNTTWDAPTRRAVAIMLGVLLFSVIYLIRPVLTFLIIAGLIAFILAPVIAFLNKRLHFPKGLAIGVSYVLFIIIVLLIPLIITPALVSAFSSLPDPATLVPLVGDLQVWAIETLEAYRILVILGTETDLSPIVDPAIESLKTISPSTFVPTLESVITYITTIFSFTWEVATGLFGRLISATLALVLTLLYSIYLSADSSKMLTGFFNLVPEPYKPEIAKLGQRINNVWNAYLRGQLTLALIIWLLTWWIGLIIGLPNAFALGVIAGAMEILPNIGPVLAAIPALLVAFLQGSTYLDVSNATFFFIVLGVYVLIQQIENNFLVPKILGDAVELSPLIIMVGVVVGFSVGGILGALIAAPTIATGREVIVYAYAKVLMQDPYPPEREITKLETSAISQLMALPQKLQSWWQQTTPKPKITVRKKPQQRLPVFDKDTAEDASSKT